MGDGVDIPLKSMSELNQALKDIVVEFDAANDRQQRLADAIGRPFGKGDLREQVDDFEGRWDDKRETLRGHLVKLQEQVEAVRKGWEDVDKDIAAHMESQE